MRHRSSYLYILGTIHLFPLEWRKFLLKCTRIQVPIIKSANLEADVQNLKHLHPVLHISDKDVLTIDWVIEQYDTRIYPSPLLNSLLAHMCRAEVLPFDSSEHLREESIVKEIQASISVDRRMQFCYDLISGPPNQFSSEGNPLVPVLGAQWRSGLQGMILRLSTHILFPTYSRSKNIGYLSQGMLCNAQDGRRIYDYQDVTQLDLIRHYHNTGEQVQGPTEMRTAFRYNDLKPRTYYAQGGEAFFAALYMREIARQLAEILPCTSKHLRYAPERVTSTSLDNEEILVTYDYSSFTTKLSELKYFLFYLGHELKGHSIFILDVRDGILEIDLGEYLLEYNSLVNEHASYDPSRVCLGEVSCLYRQTCGGMLGVQGNIGFSLALHGIAASSFDDDPIRKCIVGDDALLRCHIDDYPSLIDHVNHLGTIASDKFTMWTTPTYEQSTGVQGFAFLKRPLKLLWSGEIEFGILHTFPNIGALFNLDPTRNAYSLNIQTRFAKFAVQYGGFLRYIRQHYANYPDIIYDKEGDENDILMVMRQVYFKIGIPVIGCLPGFTPTRGLHKNFPVHMFVPPVVQEVFYEEWESLLCKSYRNESVFVPMTTYDSIHPGHCPGVGWSEECTPHRLQRIMRDLGYFEEEELYEMIIIEDSSVLRVRDISLGICRPLRRYTCIREPPIWYNEVIDIISFGPGKLSL